MDQTIPYDSKTVIVEAELAKVKIRVFMRGLIQLIFALSFAQSMKQARLTRRLGET